MGDTAEARAGRKRAADDAANVEPEMELAELVSFLAHTGIKPGVLVPLVRTVVSGLQGAMSAGSECAAGGGGAAKRPKHGPPRVPQVPAWVGERAEASEDAVVVMTAYRQGEQYPCRREDVLTTAILQLAETFPDCYTGSLTEADMSYASLQRVMRNVDTLYGIPIIGYEVCRNSWMANGLWYFNEQYQASAPREHNITVYHGTSDRAARELVYHGFDPRKASRDQCGWQRANTYQATSLPEATVYGIQRCGFEGTCTVVISDYATGNTARGVPNQGGAHVTNAAGKLVHTKTDTDTTKERASYLCPQFEGQVSPKGLLQLNLAKMQPTEQQWAHIERAWGRKAVSHLRAQLQQQLQRQAAPPAHPALQLVQVYPGAGKMQCKLLPEIELDANKIKVGDATYLQATSCTAEFGCLVGVIGMVRAIVTVFPGPDPRHKERTFVLIEVFGGTDQQKTAAQKMHDNHPHLHAALQLPGLDPKRTYFSVLKRHLISWDVILRALWTLARKYGLYHQSALPVLRNLNPGLTQDDHAALCSVVSEDQIGRGSTMTLRDADVLRLTDVYRKMTRADNAFIKAKNAAFVRYGSYAFTPPEVQRAMGDLPPYFRRHTSGTCTHARELFQDSVDWCMWVLRMFMYDPKVSRQVDELEAIVGSRHVMFDFLCGQTEQAQFLAQVGALRGRIFEMVADCAKQNIPCEYIESEHVRAYAAKRRGMSTGTL